MRVRSQPPPRVAPLGAARSPRQLYLIMPFCTICKESTKEGTRRARPGSSARRTSSKNRNTIFHINGFDFSRHLKKHKTTRLPPPAPTPTQKNTPFLLPSFLPSTHPSIHPLQHRLHRKRNTWILEAIIRFVFKAGGTQAEIKRHHRLPDPPGTCGTMTP